MVLPKSAPQISVGTATGNVERSSETATLLIPQLAADFTNIGYIMTYFPTTLFGIGPIWYADCTFLFDKHNMPVFSPGGKTILTGWREKEMPKLWRFALRPNKELLLHQNPESKKTTLLAYSAYDPPIVEAIVWYMHAASGFPVKWTWIRAIKRGNFETWPGLTYSNASKYFPQAVDTMKGHTVQSSQGVKSTKKNNPPPISIKEIIFKVVPEEEEMEYIPPPIKTKGLNIWDKPISKLHTDDCGNFPIRYRSGNE